MCPCMYVPTVYIHVYIIMCSCRLLNSVGNKSESVVLGSVAVSFLLLMVCRWMSLCDAVQLHVVSSSSSALVYI